MASGATTCSSTVKIGSLILPKWTSLLRLFFLVNTYIPKTPTPASVTPFAVSGMGSAPLSQSTPLCILFLWLSSTDSPSWRLPSPLVFAYFSRYCSQVPSCLASLRSFGIPSVSFAIDRISRYLILHNTIRNYYCLFENCCCWPPYYHVVSGSSGQLSVRKLTTFTAGGSQGILWPSPR